MQSTFQVLGPRDGRIEPPKPGRSMHLASVDVKLPEKNLGWLRYIGDAILPSYIGIIINHYKDPY